MRVVVDTSIWIEWLIGGDLRQTLTGMFPAQEDCLVPTIVQLELNKWLLRECDENIADTVIAYTQKCQILNLDTETALLAAERHRQYKLATADAISMPAPNVLVHVCLLAMPISNPFPV